MSRRLTASLLVLAVLVAVSGCVYYNTFYHATAAAREAELLRQSRPPGTEPTKQEMELLERIVEKCGRVIKLHPGSNWADDALVLMGEALYRQSKYDTAEERFTEFVALYPESEHRPRAEYYLAAVLLAKGNAVAAEELLSEVAYADPPSDLSDDALFLIGDARRKRKRYEEAAEVYLELLNRFGKSERRAEVRFVAAENFVDMGRLEEAAAQFDATSREDASRELAFESRIRLADVLIDLGRTAESLQVLQTLERRTTARNDLDRILLTRGRTFEAMGDFEGAKSTYNQVAFEHERSDAAAEAHYRIGLIYRDREQAFDQAIVSFREAKEQAPRSDVATLATAAVSDIEAVREYLEVIEARERGAAPAGAPSTEGEETAPEDARGVTRLEPARAESVPERAGAGGVTWPEPSPADSAVARQDRPEADAGGDASVEPWAVPRERSAAFGDSTATAAADTGAPEGPPPGAWSPWPPPIGPPPAAVGPPPPPEEPKETDEVAIARLRVAELYLLRLKRPLDALEYYDSVIEHHPESPLAWKAAYAIAWIKENETDDPDGALEAYREVVRRYPGTKQAAEAERAVARLGGAPVSPAPSADGAEGEAWDGGRSAWPPSD